jgi:hypothetical protein
MYKQHIRMIACNFTSISGYCESNMMVAKKDDAESNSFMPKASMGLYNHAHNP